MQAPLSACLMMRFGFFFKEVRACFSSGDRLGFGWWIVVSESFKRLFVVMSKYLLSLGCFGEGGWKWEFDLRLFLIGGRGG